MPSVDHASPNDTRAYKCGEARFYHDNRPVKLRVLFDEVIERGISALAYSEVKGPMDHPVNLWQLLANTHETMLGAQRSLNELTLSREEVLNVYWTLRDDLLRIVEIATDEAEECAILLHSEFSFLISAMVELLQETRISPLAKIAAISRVCEEINESLWQLKMLTDARQSAAG